MRQLDEIGWTSLSLAIGSDFARGLVLQLSGCCWSAHTNQLVDGPKHELLVWTWSDLENRC